MILFPGYRHPDNGNLVNTGDISIWWAASSQDGQIARNVGLKRGNQNANSNLNNRNFAFSLRFLSAKESLFLWIIMFSLSDIFTAYYDCRAHKRNTLGALEFELHYEGECIALWDEIESRTYRLQPCTAFIVRDPVQREIFASHFRDRVVHHLIARRLTPILERVFIHDVYNSRCGKGTHYGIDRVDHFMRSCSENYSRDAYVLKLDISGFFMSIDREKLWEKVKGLICHSEVRRICSITRDDEAIQKKNPPNPLSQGGMKPQKIGIPKDEQDIFLYLIEIIIFTDIKKSVIIKGKRIDCIGLPHNKSLFYAKKGCGVPIGNLTSQLFANIYMHEFDIFVKKTLKVKYYGRYVDDFILIHRDRAYLRSCIPVIRDFLMARLGLTLHPRKIYLQHISKGVLFLGTFIKLYRRYIGKRTKGNLYRLIESINTRLSDPVPFSDLEQDCIPSQMNSYLGLLSHTQSYRLRSKMMSMLDERFWEYCIRSDDIKKIKIKAKK